MKNIQWNRWAAVVLAGLSGLAAGVLLSGGAMQPSHRLPGSNQQAVAAFAQQSFSISSLPTAQVQQAATPLPSLSGPQPARPTPAPQAAEQPTPAPEPTAPAAPAAGGFSIRLLDPQKASGSILIYHTHTYEAFEQGQPAYRETERWRTADESCNMVRVGEELATLLRALGYHVVHDTTAFEPPELSSSYTRSLAMLESRIEAGEHYDLYIDLHRDAFVEGQAGENTVIAGGTQVARLMMLIGKGEGYTGTGYDRRPDWEANLAVAQSITDALNEQVDGLCKQVRLKSGRFNQHVAEGCVLVEAGNNRNTLAQVLAAMPYLADAIHRTLCP